MKWAPLVIAAITFLASPGWAHPYGKSGDNINHQRGMAHQEHRGILFGDMEYLEKTLDLDKEQIRKIGLINSRYSKELVKFRNQLRPKKTMLREMLLLDRVEYSALKQLLHEISDIETELRFLRIKHRLDIETILTPGQKQQLRNERKEKRRSGKHGRKAVY